VENKKLEKAASGTNDVMMVVQEQLDLKEQELRRLREDSVRIAAPQEAQGCMNIQGARQAVTLAWGVRPRARAGRSTTCSTTLTS
jgi:hypothetical protein